ncbi:MAG: hypothetical protein WD080_11630 [Egibacteraceae bacterium]
MRAKRSSTTPLYIPDELLRAYGPEARWQVATSVSARHAREASSSLRPVAPAGTDRLVRFAAYTGLVAWGGLVALWVWLALRDPMLWAPIAMSGTVVLVLAAVALPRVFTAFRTRRLRR